MSEIYVCLKREQKRCRNLPVESVAVTIFVVVYTLMGYGEFLYKTDHLEI